MAWAFPLSEVDTTTIVALGSGDGVFVGSGVVIATTGNSPTVDGNDNQHKAIVHGTVVGNLLAITLGVVGDPNFGHEVTIGASGIVEALAANGVALRVSGANSTVLNEGLIQALDGIAVVMDSDGFGTGSSLSNAGIVRGGPKAIVRNASSSETLTFNNSGLVEGVFAYDATDFLANDLITNTGRIVGTIGLGQGDDVYNGAGGRLSGLASGGQGSDQLIGGVDDDQFAGGSGDDTLTGNAGNDALEGGTGNDTLTGNAGNDTLFGDDGNDTLNGGDGNDVYFLENESDTVNDAGGIDTITSTVSRSLAGYASIERLTLLNVASALNGNGNNLANLITGNNFNNTLNGGLGNDTLLGGLGADTLIGGAGNDVLDGGANNDTLDGGANNDTLRGLDGNDILIGNLGRDVMTGGANNDIFRFGAASHSPAGNPDVITDFDDFGDDRIDVSALFGPAMTYRHNQAFTAAGQVRISDIAGPDLIVQVNTGGSLAADFAIRLAGTTLGSMTASDFIL